MPLYNFALPLTPEIEIAVVAYCGKHFKDIADGHLAVGISPHSIPHITIAQFECDESTLKTKAPQILSHTPVTVVCRSIYCDKGNGIHTGFDWHGLGIEKSQGLIDLQNFFIETTSLTPLTGHGENYSPHITFARVPHSQTIPPLPEITFPAFQAAGRLFDCDINGQCLRLIEPV